MWGSLARRGRAAFPWLNPNSGMAAEVLPPAAIAARGKKKKAKGGAGQRDTEGDRAQRRAMKRIQRQMAKESLKSYAFVSFASYEAPDPFTHHYPGFHFLDPDRAQGKKKKKKKKKGGGGEGGAGGSGGFEDFGFHGWAFGGFEFYGCPPGDQEFPGWEWERGRGGAQGGGAGGSGGFEDFEDGWGSSQDATVAEHCKALGIPEDKSSCRESIKAAWLRTALAWHPDRHPEGGKSAAERTFKAKQDSYQFLADRLL